jgi:NitT/TauT family transport system ATP-binding protein
MAMVRRNVSISEMKGSPLPDVRIDSAPQRGPGPAMIAIDHVSQLFQTSGRQSHLALSDISLTIEEGAFVSILGPSGCGKSTLLYIVGGFVNPTQGAVTMNGRAIAGPGPDRGPVFQEFALFPWKTVLGNVMYGPRQQGVKSADAEAQARTLIEMVGLKGYENFYPKELSGGMKQRVALARTLAYHPAVLLMDEPFGALDAHTRTRLQNDLLNIWERDRKTVLFVTHSVEEAVFLSDKVVVMTRSPGRIKQVIDIDLPRPRRRAELLLDPRYQKYVVGIERMIDDTSDDGLRP